MKKIVYVVEKENTGNFTVEYRDIVDNDNPKAREKFIKSFFYGKDMDFLKMDMEDFLEQKTEIMIFYEKREPKRIIVYTAKQWYDIKKQEWENEKKQLGFKEGELP